MGEAPGTTIIKSGYLPRTGHQGNRTSFPSATTSVTCVRHGRVCTTYSSYTPSSESWYFLHSLVGTVSNADDLVPPCFPTVEWFRLGVGTSQRSRVPTTLRGVGRGRKKARMKKVGQTNLEGEEMTEKKRI